MSSISLDDLENAIRQVGAGRKDPELEPEEPEEEPEPSEPKPSESEPYPTVEVERKEPKPSGQPQAQPFPSSRSPTVVSFPPPRPRQKTSDDGIFLECFPGQGSGEFKCLAVEGTMPSRGSTEQIWLQYARKYRSSFVQVFASLVGFNPFSPHHTAQSGEALGSGFFITESGHFLTNSHVIQKAQRVRVKMHSMGETLIPAIVLGLAMGKDVALCQITKHALNRLKEAIIPLTFGDSDKLEIPEALATCGFPLGHSGVKVTLGNLSGHSRSLSALTNALESHYIQITTPLNSGVSGGCVLNMAGLVVGIASQGNIKAQNVGYAIPSKVVLSILRPLFSTVYENKLVPVPSLPYEWQTINREGLQISNVDEEYSGGILITRKTNLILKTIPQDQDLQPGDVIVEVRFFNPYSEDTNYLDVNTYRPDKNGNHVFFPSLERSRETKKESQYSTTSSSSTANPQEIWGQKSDTITSNCIDIQYQTNSPNYLDGGVKWNISRDKEWPLFRVLFNLGDETIIIQEQKQYGSKWELVSLYQQRKMFFTDILDILPAGLPLTFIIFRGGTKLCIRRAFYPIPWESQGLRIIYPPYEDFSNEYEILGGLVLANLYLNHFQFCLPHIMKRLDGFCRYQDAVVTVNVLGLSSIAKDDNIEGLDVLQYIELFAPHFVAKEGQNTVQHRSIYKSNRIYNIANLREALTSLVSTGITFFKNEVNNRQEQYSTYLRRKHVVDEIKRVEESQTKKDWNHINQILASTYNVEGKETVEEELNFNTLVDRYQEKVIVQKEWTKFLPLKMVFEKGNTFFFSFPYIFLEDLAVEEKLGISQTPFMRNLVINLFTNLIEPNSNLFSTPKKHRTKPQAIPQKGIIIQLAS